MSNIDPHDLLDIARHKPFRWLLVNKHTIQDFSKGEWGEVRFEWGFICGFFIGAVVGAAFLWSVLVYCMRG